MINSNNLTNTSDRLFRRLALLTVVVIYLLILVGGIVRSTGSGMGCPDWPKCFGQWVPPTDVSQLPPNYQEIYSHRGYANTSFNVVKTWTEYLNRLLGVFTGFFIFLTFLASLRYRKHDFPVTALSFLAFILVGVQGWLGAVVVSSVLTPWIITLHMLLAIVIVGMLLYVTARTYAAHVQIATIQNKANLNRWLAISTLLLLAQVLLGTQVREAVDHIGGQIGEQARQLWVENLGLSFYIHRSFSLLVFGAQLYWLIKFKTQKTNTGVIALLANWVIVLLGVEIITGAIMAYFAIPTFLQPVHLTLAIVALGIQFVLLLLLNKEYLFPARRYAGVKSGEAV
ncbi:COX15/CtaA family protein [Nibrella viscosa]|uniref:COX15/CtaA family protein n=1 Tax=Nibrella viscosa TaxID=1084524 RepID=A0ABP8KIR8_9BACT